MAGYQQHTLWGGTLWHPAGPSTSLRFPGQYFDPETGLHYNQQRYYDPVTGSYLTPDPFGLAPAPNPHAYVPNPLQQIDPLGLTPCPPRSARNRLDRDLYLWPDQRRWTSRIHATLRSRLGSRFRNRRRNGVTLLFRPIRTADGCQNCGIANRLADLPGSISVVPTGKGKRPIHRPDRCTVDSRAWQQGISRDLLYQLPTHRMDPLTK